jgi:hypothetical protein
LRDWKKNLCLIQAGNSNSKAVPNQIIAGTVIAAVAANSAGSAPFTPGNPSAFSRIRKNKKMHPGSSPAIEPKYPAIGSTTMQAIAATSAISTTVSDA